MQSGHEVSLHSSMGAGCKRTACPCTPDCHPIRWMTGEQFPIPLFLVGQFGCRHISIYTHRSIETNGDSDRVSDRKTDKQTRLECLCERSINDY